MSSSEFLTEFLTAAFIAAHKRQQTQPVIDDYHGTNVADPYRWLEDPSCAETHAWLSAQNRATTAYIEALPDFQQINQEITAIWDYPRYTLLEKHGQRYFFEQNSGLQQQYLLMMQRGLEGEPRRIFDPNTLSQDGTLAIHTTFFNTDGTLMAYGLSENGSDWQQVHIRRIDDNADSPEILQWTRHSLIAWRPDSLGFYYSRYPEPGTVAPEDAMHFHRVYFHTVGTPQTEDLLIYERPDAKNLKFHPRITDDGAYLLLNVTQGTTSNNRWYYRKGDSGGPFIRLLDEADATYRFIGNSGPLFYFRTTLDAPRGRIIAIDVEAPEREHWREVIPQQEDAMHFAVLANNQLVVAFLQDVHHVLWLYTCDGHLLRNIPLPLGSIVAISGKSQDREMFFGFTSFLSPITIYRYDFSTETLAVFRQSACRFDASPYTISHIFYPSKDGTQIPLFLVHQKDLILDGTHPTILHGYGGFRISQMPEFSRAQSFWLAHGGIYAVANLRGGGEYGEEWHEAGILEKKQNVFDDFIAAAEWLIMHHYTSASRLAINGGSNGGRLVAACTVQRPDLFGAVLCRVPVIDMLRYSQHGRGSKLDC